MSVTVKISPKAALKEIIRLIDYADQPDDEGNPTRQPGWDELYDLTTEIYLLAETALGLGVQP